MRTDAPSRAASWRQPYFAQAGPGRTVNDVHSRLNATPVARIVTPQSVRELQAAIVEARTDGQRVAVAGGRHSMGGQQFARHSVLLDMRAMSRVDEIDPERGLVTVEAGIDWVRLVNHLLWAGAGDPHPWTIIQKQTGADQMTIGGALSSNIHGRGLSFRPLVGDIESFELVRPDGTLVTCSRRENRDLFSLAVGGYGLFGAIARVTLRLTRRHEVERRVAIARVDDLPCLFEHRIEQGFTFGDFQFATDTSSREFMQVGVLSCYRPVTGERSVTTGGRALDHRDWRRLLLLAHNDKSRAFAEYARHYMSTDGQVYWSDTHQLSQYIEGYHDAIDRQLGAVSKGSEMISELFVPRADLPAFMAAARDDARRHEVNVIYGTVRLIEQEDDTVLAWARQPWACIVINIHVDHSPEGIRKAQGDMRRLIDTAGEFGGSYYLTYHRWATRDQVERCHPRMREFLRLKAAHDPTGLFSSDWYAHHVRLMGGARTEQWS